MLRTGSAARLGADLRRRQQWEIDDPPGQLRQRLHTTLADSRLERGYLIQHNDCQRGALSGQDFDLATLGWAN